MRPLGTPQALEHRRRFAIQLLKEGYQPIEVARKVGADRRSVRRWNSSHRKNGLVALKAKPASGRPAKLTQRQKSKLTGILLKGAKAQGFSTDLWTCSRVLKLIDSKFKALYHVDHIGRLLHTLGFSPQKPQRRAVERDERAIHSWTKTTWQNIKKKPGD